MKFKLLLLSFFIPLSSFGQRDTTIYYSETFCPIPTINSAVRYEKLVVLSNSQFALFQYNKVGNKWQKPWETSIRKQTDSSFSMISYGKTIRVFNKIDSGYLIKDYQNSILTSTGYSKLIFPLIRFGIWKYYNSSTGKKETEHSYFNNQIISSKYWVNDFTSYSDSLGPDETPPLFKGGDYAMLKFIAENLEYPMEAKENDIQGRVILKCLISSEGEIAAPLVLNKVDRNLARESIRVINLTKGKWIPGKKGSYNSDSFKIIPVTFTLK